MTRDRGAPGAWLIDLYDTVLSVEFGVILAELAATAGIPPERFAEAAAVHAPDVTLGRTTLDQALAAVIVDCGHEPDPALVTELVDRNHTMLLAGAEVHEDALDLLQALRHSGSPVALVSNSGANTRGVVEGRHLADLVDDIVLSADVGSAKPDPDIYRVAATRLGVSPESAIMVDDELAYCRGARALGMDAVQIVRGGNRGRGRRDGVRQVFTLRDLLDLA